MRQILVLGGTHGNEMLGIQLVQLLKERPIKGVTAMIANPCAVEQNRRYIESDLNRSFGSLYLGTYETNRAAELRQIISNYDVVLDLHNTMTPDNDSSFVGPDCNNDLYDVSAQLGLLNCIEATYDCVNKFCPNTLSIEVSLNGKLDSAIYWYNKIALLASGRLSKKGEIERYRYYGRVTWDEAENIQTTWRPFVRISQEDRLAIGVEAVVYPIFIGSRLTEYYATLITKQEGR